MDKYLFLLGRTPELSVSELTAVGFHGQLLKEHLYQVEADASDEAKLVAQFQQLGGALKLLKVVGAFTDLAEDQLVPYLAAYFAQFPRPTLAVGELYRDSLPKVEPSAIKAELKTRGVSSRFVDGPRDGLSAAVLLHQEVNEVLVIRLSQAQTLFATTLSVQDIDEWTRRDRQKPYADRKKGMLPPKVARMMVNLGLGAWRQLETSQAGSTPVPPTTPVIYDPFCGSGTILLEAAHLGYPVVGSDLDPVAVAGTTSNVDWLADSYHLDVNATVFQADVTHVTADQLDQRPNLIITEPFLGKQTPAPHQLANVFRGMEKLYLGAFRQWRHLLTDQAVVVIIFPVAHDGKHSYSLESIIDKLAVLGYTPTSEPCLYHRPLAVIQRQIWTFQFKQP